MEDYKKLITIEITCIKREFFKQAFITDSWEQASGSDAVIGDFICFTLCIGLEK